MEGHGTDKERLDKLEIAHARTDARLSSLVDSVTRMESAIEKQTANLNLQIQEIKTAITKPTQWGVIAAWVAPALLVGGFFWGEVKYQQIRTLDRIAQIEQSRYTREDGQRENDRLFRQIENLREWMADLEQRNGG